ncbi:MAG: hypothetical protein EBV06_01295 [Planctomycetia bacterium]|nr:hypothetical protein [Planctomycetia bacterium]
MPVIVHCPSCTGPLRVGDDLIGRKVRCPSCNTIFEAPRETASGTESGYPSSSASTEWQHLNIEVNPQAKAPLPPIETVPVDPWKTMNLSLDEPAPSSHSVQEPNTSRLPSVPVDSQRRETNTPSPSRHEQPLSNRRARLNDDDDDLRACPSCRKLIHRFSRRCSGCGEEFDDYRERSFRRDGEPHRGSTVLLLGIMSLVTPFIGCLTFGISSPVGLVLGIIAWTMSSFDLRKMRDGLMDPDGESNTRAGLVCAIIGVTLNSLMLVSCGMFVTFAILSAR